PTRRPAGLHSEFPSRNLAELEQSGNELVAARFRHQYLRVRRIGLDLLPETIDMRLQRVGRDTRVIAPDLVQQNIPAHHLLTRPVKVLEDGRFLLRKADLAAVLADKQLGARSEERRAGRERR